MKILLQMINTSVTRHQLSLLRHFQTELVNLKTIKFNNLELLFLFFEIRAFDYCNNSLHVVVVIID